MMPRRLPGPSVLAALVAAAFLASAHPARADVGPPVDITIFGDGSVLPVPGQTFSFDVTLEASEPITVTAPAFDAPRLPGGGYSWDPVSFPLPPALALQPGSPATYPVTLLCADPRQPITISVQAGGRKVVRDFFLLPRSALGVSEGVESTALIEGSDKGAPASPDTDQGLALPAPAPPRRPHVDRTADGKRQGDPAKSRNIRVRGRFVYYRDSRDDDGNYVGDGREMGADGVTLRVWDSDVGFDEMWASTVLGPSGEFDLTFWYDDGEDPDIYLEFEAANAHISVDHPGIGGTAYDWFTGTTEDYTGSSLNYGTRYPANDDYYPAVHLCATATKGWRWYNDFGYGGIDDVTYSWPNDDWPNYSSVHETIYMPHVREWNEGTILHEYGHHWMSQFSSQIGTDYCNGRCDDPGDCGHCMWCAESAGDALREGFPNWIAFATGDEFASRYGFTPIMPRTMEDLRMCADPDPDVWDDPWTTEGYISAFLQDVVDAANEDDPSGGFGLDVMTWSPQIILDIQAVYEPHSPAALLQQVYLANPADPAAIWLTATNNGLDTDSTPPTAPSLLWSPTHETTGDSADQTITLSWSTPTDDMSGIDRYLIWWGETAAADHLYIDAGASTLYSTLPFSPGSYWFRVRAVDRAGNQGPFSPTYGPVTIREPLPADLDADAGTWPYPVVPRITADATATSAPLPAALIGNSASTYFNLRIRNTGDITTPSDNLRLYLRLDGVLAVDNVISPLPGLSSRAYLNLGPYTVRGGRHSLTLQADGTERLAEANEADNEYWRQFIWHPSTVSNGTWASRTYPPDAYGGFEWSLLLSPNCDGLAWNLGADTYAGLVILADNPTHDFDLRSHDATTGPTDGFNAWSGTLAASFRPAGCLDAVFTNNNLTGTNTWNAGVLNYDGERTAGYRIRRVASTAVATGTDVTVTIPDGEWLALRHFNLAGGSGANYGTVTVAADPAQGPIRAMVIGNDVVHAGLDDSPYQAVTDTAGHAVIDFTYTASLNGLAIWQDPVDSPGAKAALTVTVRVGYTPVDFTSVTPAGWAYPIVPTTGAPGTPAAVALPAVLNGNAATTYINAAFRNAGPNTASFFNSMTFLDGVALTGSQIAGLAGLSNHLANYGAAFSVRGGRHTLSVRPDFDGQVAESNEGNNDWGRQYCWTPLALSYGPAIGRAAPPDPHGGHAEAIAAALGPIYPNCDGLRTPMPAPAGNDGWWQAVVALPGAASDVDLRLHETASGVTGPFADVLETSGAGPGEADYVLANLRATAPRAFDVGAIGAAGTEAYLVQTVGSTFLAASPAGTYGPFALGAGHLLALHDVELPAGFLAIGVQEEGGAVDWGLTLHRAGVPFQSRTAGPGLVGQAWGRGPAESEHVVVQIPQAGRYCVAVWKAASADAAKAGSYRLVFEPGVTALPDTPGQQPPAATALTGVHPNPFNPQVTVAWELAQAGRVDLAIYDARGARVRSLVAGERPAGRHEAVWNGRDDAGAAVPSGVYFARLRAGGAVALKKMTLVK